MLQKQVNLGKYGPSLSDVEKQIAAHNILHKEIDSYRSQQKVCILLTQLLVHCSVTWLEKFSLTLIYFDPTGSYFWEAVFKPAGELCFSIA